MISAGLSRRRWGAARPDRGQELIDVEGLGEVTVGPGREQPLGLHRRRIGRDDDHGGAGKLLIAAHGGQHLLTGDVRQVQVEQDQVGPELARQGHAGRALTGDAQAEVAGEPEDLLDKPHVRRVVLDVEH